MSRLLQFLSGLSTSKFYGEVRIQFRAGELGKITVEQSYLEESLPKPADQHEFERWMARQDHKKAPAMT